MKTDKSKNNPNWQQRNFKVNWHPYTQHAVADSPIVIQKGAGAKLWDVDGNEYIDAIGSWWCNPHGHSHPKIVEAVYEQMQTLEHVLFGGFSHPPAIELSEKLLSVLPGAMGKIFYSDNGSTAIEVGLKMALQYFYNQGDKRDCFIAFEGAFHGDTFGAMASSGVDFFTTHFADFMFQVERLPLPNEDNFEQVYAQLEQIISTKNPAAFIFEPLVQGAAGMRMYEAKHLDALVGLCRKNTILTIADEVMTGFGRTGKLFASQHLKNTPDIICLSKALTGGFLPLAVTACKQWIYHAFHDEDQNKAFFHGHTFMANPSCCAAALASLELSLSPETKMKSSLIEQSHAQFAERLRGLGFVKNIKQLGIILRCEVDNGKENAYYGELRNWMYRYFIHHGVITRPIGNVVYILPPYCIEADELNQVYETIWSAFMELKSMDFRI